MTNKMFPNQDIVALWVQQSKYNYPLAELAHWTSECGQSHTNVSFVTMVIYAGSKTADLFMNECFMNER